MSRWNKAVYALTCFIPCYGCKNPHAFREKVALNVIIFSMMGVAAVLTLFPSLLCPSQVPNNVFYAPSFANWTAAIVRGTIYDFNGLSIVLNQKLPDRLRSSDLTLLFPSGDCNDYGIQNCTLANVTSCQSASVLSSVPSYGSLFYYWKDVERSKDLAVFNGQVINYTRYIQDPSLDVSWHPYFQKNPLQAKDASYLWATNFRALTIARCMLDRYKVGVIDSQTPGCIASQIVTGVLLIIVLGVMIAKLLMALFFYFFISTRLTKVPFHARSYPKPFEKNEGIAQQSTMTLVNSSATEDPFLAMLVTCYSEGEDAIYSTLASLAETDYPNDRKLLIVISDGLIVGSGNTKSTPDIILSLIQTDPHIPKPEPKSYVAVADGVKQHNRATVHAGFFVSSSRKVPILVIIKCGAPDEKDSPKPGNRGKRDSQLILMSFFHRLLFKERITPLDYELFCKWRYITGVSPVHYETLLMVDADTVIRHDAIMYMIRAMKNNPKIMGLCGETQVTNKNQNWVTSIQVFEYFLSHHLGKAFESVFGGVTCLPGCFSMYRIKTHKGPGGKWMVPLLVNPDIIQEYSRNYVNTLHKKNLLLLGEDRFLSTLMLRTFPRRQMVFVPQAVCRTTVPDSFRVLLSQRRRWINSTIHNLLELVLLRDLCGIFCFSMQFIVMLDLIGSVILPGAIVLTFYLIINLIIYGASNILSLVTLLAVLALPGIVIIIATNKPELLPFMVIYLLALPVWNLLLPLYAFWHFDDFSWGETRKVDGDTSMDGHQLQEDSGYKIGSVIMKKMEDWDATVYQSYAASMDAWNLQSHPMHPPVCFQEDSTRWNASEGNVLSQLFSNQFSSMDMKPFQEINSVTPVPVNADPENLTQSRPRHSIQRVKRPPLDTNRLGTLGRTLGSVARFKSSISLKDPARVVQTRSSIIQPDLDANIRDFLLRKNPPSGVEVSETVEHKETLPKISPPTPAMPSNLPKDSSKHCLTGPASTTVVQPIEKDLPPLPIHELMNDTLDSSEDAQDWSKSVLDLVNAPHDDMPDWSISVIESAGHSPKKSNGPIDLEEAEDSDEYSSYRTAESGKKSAPLSPVMQTFAPTDPVTPYRPMSYTRPKGPRPPPF